MKPWRLLLAVALAATAVLLLTSIVVAAPASTEVRANGVYYGPQPILTGTMPMTHPVGIAIARYFNISYTLVMSWHAQGFGFGTIARAYLTANASHGALTPTQVLALHQASVGWGQIKKDYGVHPGGNGLGSIMGKKQVQPEPATSTAPEVKPDKTASKCPGNSCNAPGQNKPNKGSKPDTPKRPKNK